MRILYLFALVIFFGACKSQQMDNNTGSKSISASPETCPDSGTCNIVLHKNSKLTLLEDGTGAMYPDIGKGNNLVVEFSYSEKGPEGTADGNYSETIHFEIPNDIQTLSLKNNGLTEVNMLWGKHCYCKGEAGFFPVLNGSLKAEKMGNSLIFEVKFNMKEREQKINHVKRTVKL